MATDGAYTGTTLLGYYVEDMLGIGPLGEVYRAVYPSLPQPIALRIFAKELDRTSPAMLQLRDEATRVSILNHPTIARLFGFEHDEEHMILTTSLMRESLEDALARDGVRSLAWSVRQAMRLASGLQAAHKAGVVHGDLKPTNILLDEQSHSYLTDFGHRHALPRRSAPDAFLAPELRRPAKSPKSPKSTKSARSADVYALAALVYLMLTGAAPAADLAGALTPPSRLNTAIGPQIDAVLLRALATPAATRYPDSLSFATDLVRAQAAQEPLSIVLPPLGSPNGVPRASPPGLQRNTGPEMRADDALPALVETTSQMAMAAPPTACADEADVTLEVDPLTQMSLPVPAIRLTSVAAARGETATRRTWMLWGAIAVFALLSLTLGAALILTKVSAPNTPSAPPLTPSPSAASTVVPSTPTSVPNSSDTPVMTPPGRWTAPSLPPRFDNPASRPFVEAAADQLSDHLDRQIR